MLTLDVADGATPLIHDYWRMFTNSEGVPRVPHWGSHRPGVLDERTLYFRRSDYVYTNFVLLTFTDSADPVPDRKWTPGGIQAPDPWPKLRDVLLGQTPLGFAHLLLPPTADEEWPQCEEQVRATLGTHLTSRDVVETPKTSAPEAKPIPPARDAPQVRSNSGYGRSALGLLQNERLLVAFYARGSIAFEANSVREQFDEQGTWSIDFVHTTEESQTNKYHLEYRQQSPHEVRVNDRVIPLGTALTVDGAEDQRWTAGPSATEPDASRGIWCGLTTWGRVQSTQRWFEWLSDETDPDKSELNHERQFSMAWYLDNDLFAFESYRTTLEMDDLTNVVIAWDRQHPIQHSDGARAAMLRVLADGRVFASNNGRETIQSLQLTPAELADLIEKLLPLFGEPLPPGKPGDIPLTAGAAHWDAEQESFVLSHAGKTYRVEAQSPSLSDPENRLGIEPLHAPEIRDVLNGLIQTAYAGGPGNLARCAEFATAELRKRHPESSFKFTAADLSWAGLNSDGTRVVDFAVVGTRVSPQFVPSAEFRVYSHADGTITLRDAYYRFGATDEESDRWGRDWEENPKSIRQSQQDEEPRVQPSPTTVDQEFLHHGVPTLIAS
jgi:hypothetical protein